MRCSICSWLVAATWVPQQRFVSTPGMETTRTGPTWSLGSPRVWAWHVAAVTRGSTRDGTHLVQLRVPDLEGVDGDGERGPDDLVAALLHRGQVRLAHRPVHLDVGHAHLGLGVLRHPPGQSLEAAAMPGCCSVVLCDLRPPPASPVCRTASPARRTGGAGQSAAACGPTCGPSPPPVLRSVTRDWTRGTRRQS